MSRTGTVRPLAIGAIAAACLMPAGGVRAAATIVVNTGTDHAAGAGECSGVDGDCSLRQAIHKAASGDTIQIPSSVAANDVTLGVIPIAKDLTISGAGSASVTVDGHLNSGIFNVTGGRTISMSGLTFTRAKAASGAVEIGR